VSAPRGIVVCNPPYGERLSNKNDVQDLYRQMRRVFARAPGGA
jgi:23S rRNA G2445 N2-methylase RlmL